MTDPVLAEFGQKMQKISDKLDAARAQASKIAPLDPNSQRGRLVLAKALAYAISAIDLLPRNRQEWSDRQDMANLLLNAPGIANWALNAVRDAEAHTQIEVDVFDHKSDPDDAA